MVANKYKDNQATIDPVGYSTQSNYNSDWTLTELPNGQGLGFTGKPALLTGSCVRPPRFSVIGTRYFLALQQKNCPG